MKVIFLSGPPRAGKDTFAGLLRTKFTACGLHVELLRISEPLEAAAQAFGFDMRDEVKDDMDSVMRMSRRQFQIKLSEDLLKPCCGKKVLGEIAINKLFDIQDRKLLDVAIFYDSGFRDEAQPFFDRPEFECWRVQLSRPGKTYTDSRSDWIWPFVERRIDVDNDRDLIELNTKATLVVREILNEPNPL